MAAMATNDRDGSDADSRSETVVGSVAGSGYRMGETHGEGIDASEETSLLGAGADESDIDELGRQRTDSWVGWQDFTDLPPWRRPSVCVIPDLRRQAVAQQ